MSKSSETVNLPGAVDLHVHLRQPSPINTSETIASGTEAALQGGYTLVCDMPNNPKHETWTFRRLQEKQRLIFNDALVPVATYSGSQPESDNIGQLRYMSRSSIGLKLYGAPTTGTERDYEADEFSEIIREWHIAAPDKPIMLHAGKDNLPDFIDLIARTYGHHLHVCHVRGPEDVRLVSRAKADGLPITCGVCPHHLFKTSHDVISEGWFARVQPPLAPQSDAEQLLHLLAAGDIDVVETDHAPHTVESKLAAEAENPHGIHEVDHRTCFGLPGIEFAMPLLFYQQRLGRISMERLVEATAIKPAEIIGVRNTSKVEWSSQTYRIGEDEVTSRSGWTPYMGKLAAGAPVSVKIGGRYLMRDGRTIGKTSQVMLRGGIL